MFLFYLVLLWRITLEHAVPSVSFNSQQAPSDGATVELRVNPPFWVV